MAKGKDEYCTVRIRTILDESIRRLDRLRSDVSYRPTPSPWLREAIIGKPSEVWVFALLSTGCSAAGAFGCAWIAGELFDLSSASKERVFWILLTAMATLGAGNMMRGAMGERAIDWARKGETAEDHAFFLRTMLEDIECHLEGAVPNLDRFQDGDIYGESPMVDAALKGLRLPDRSRPSQSRGNSLSGPTGAEPTVKTGQKERALKAERREPTVIRRS